MKRTTFCFITFCFLLLFPSASTVRGDEIRLRDGRTLRGEATRQADGRWRVRTDGGSELILSAREVLSVRPGKTIGDRYEERAGAIRIGRVEDQAELARWCAEHGLRRRAADHWAKVLLLDPDHAVARRSLGYIRHEGEWLTEEAYYERLGLRRFRGRLVPIEEARQLEAKAELGRRMGELWPVVRRAAEGDEEAIGRLAALKAPLVRQLHRHALDSPVRAIRELGARTLGKLKDRDALAPLARVAIRDKDRSVRLTAVRAIRATGHPDAAVPFIHTLNAPKLNRRLHAIEALSVLPDRRAVYWLIATMRADAAGFGRVHSYFGTLRSYIRDYQLAAGGTGQNVTEVADPVIGTLETGVVQDVNIRKVEMLARVQTLQYLTGADIGADRNAWMAWYEKKGDAFSLPVEGRRK